MNHFSHLLSFNQQQTYVYYIYLYRYSALFYSGSPALLKHQSRFLAPKQKRRDHRSTKVLRTRKGHETMGIVGVLMEFRPPPGLPPLPTMNKISQPQKKSRPLFGGFMVGKKTTYGQQFLGTPVALGKRRFLSIPMT